MKKSFIVQQIIEFDGFPLIINNNSIYFFEVIFKIEVTSNIVKTK